MACLKCGKTAYCGRELCRECIQAEIIEAVRDEGHHVAESDLEARYAITSFEMRAANKTRGAVHLVTEAWRGKTEETRRRAIALAMGERC